MIRFGLCCLFKDEAVSFRTTTAKSLLTLQRDLQLRKLSDICTHNADNLFIAVETAHRLGIGAFRIMSPLFPRMTHPDVGYRLEDLPDCAGILETLRKIRDISVQHDMRLSFHPDQFVVLSSPHPHVVRNSILELEYHGWLAELVGADVINIHAGGVYEDKLQALRRLAGVISELPATVRSRLTIENDDVSYTVNDLLPICREIGIPLVYDVHHHRCNPDGLTTEDATRLSAETWNSAGREQYCHLSSPKSGWGDGNPKPHADYIDRADFPECWKGREMTVDIEAKAKELAVIRLMSELNLPETSV